MRRECPERVAQLTEIVTGGRADRSKGELNGDAPLLSVAWQDPAPDGGLVIWQAVTDPRRHPERSLLRFIAGLTIVEN